MKQLKASCSARTWLICVIFLSFVFVGSLSSWAFAGELDSDKNAVNVQQPPDSSFIYDTSIVDLGTADTYYDDQTVQVTGEAIGETIKAGLGNSYCWVTLASDDSKSTVSVFMPAEAAKKIGIFGRYGSKGATVQVQGTYHLACTDHEGLSDIHAEVVTVVEQGHATPQKFNVQAFVPGIIAVVIGLILTAIYRWMRERQR